MWHHQHRNFFFQIQRKINQQWATCFFNRIVTQRTKAVDLLECVPCCVAVSARGARWCGGGQVWRTCRQHRRRCGCDNEVSPLRLPPPSLPSLRDADFHNKDLLNRARKSVGLLLFWSNDMRIYVHIGSQWELIHKWCSLQSLTVSPRMGNRWSTRSSLSEATWKATWLTSDLSSKVCACSGTFLICMLVSLTYRVWCWLLDGALSTTQGSAVGKLLHTFSENLGVSCPWDLGMRTKAWDMQEMTGVNHWTERRTHSTSTSRFIFMMTARTCNIDENRSGAEVSNTAVLSAELFNLTNKANGSRVYWVLCKHWWQFSCILQNVNTSEILWLPRHCSAVRNCGPVWAVGSTRPGKVSVCWEQSQKREAMPPLLLQWRCSCSFRMFGKFEDQKQKWHHAVRNEDSNIFSFAHDRNHAEFSCEDPCTVSRRPVDHKSPGCSTKDNGAEVLLDQKLEVRRSYFTFTAKVVSLRSYEVVVRCPHQEPCWCCKCSGFEQIHDQRRRSWPLRSKLLLLSKQCVMYQAKEGRRRCSIWSSFFPN